MSDAIYLNYILPNKWDDLIFDIDVGKEFNCDAFIEVFKETFDIFRKYSCKDHIDREIVHLINRVSVFTAIDCSKTDYSHRAARELAEAMLYNCFICDDKPEKEITEGEWCYIIGAGNMPIDFTDPEGELDTIAYELENWDSIPVTPGDSDD